MAAKDLYEKDFYAILGVEKKASGEEIKKKYRSLAREFHPDKTKGDDELEEKFKAVSEAYDILSDSKKRAEYDEARSLFERGGFRGPMGGQGGGDFSDLFGGGVSSSYGGSSVVEKNLDRITIVVGGLWFAGVIVLSLVLKK